VASLTAPLLDRAGAKAGALDLAGEVFGADVKHHLVHETVPRRAVGSSPGGARSRGARRAPVGPVRGRLGRHSGPEAEWPLRRSLGALC